MTSRLTAGLLAFLALGTAAPAAAQEVPDQLDRIRREVEEAQASDLRFVAPRLVRRAAEAVEEAAALREEGARDQEVLEPLSRARRALERARGLEGPGLELLAPGLRARESAREAGAPEHAPQLWAEAEEELRSAGRSLEDDDPEGAAEDAERAARRYRRAERSALEGRVLAAPREARGAAEEAGAPDRAPATWRRADSLLARADTALAAAVGPDGGEEALGRARDLAGRAGGAFRRAARLAARADSARSRDGGVERFLLRYEAALGRIADSLGLEGADPGEPSATADAALEALARRASGRAELRARLDSARAAGREAGERADSLAAETARLSRRLDTLESELERRRAREGKLREVRALFSGEQARVLMRGDSLVLRLVGVRFPPGEAEVGEGARPLLVKAQSAIRTFPDARVVIEGHTDARGDADRNRTLSRERAISVREWLLARTPLSADRIAATGRGASRPVAPNDTEAGRAANRRIEVILVLPEP
jgi:chemotaxis protein MotB